MIATRLNSYKDLYYQLDILDNIEDLTYYANNVLKSDSNNKLWFVEGLIYYTYISAEVHAADSKSKESVRKTTLKRLLKELGVNVNYTKLGNSVLKDIVYLEVRNLIKLIDLDIAIQQSNLEDYVKEEALGFLKAGLDPIGYFSSDTYIEFRASFTEENYGAFSALIWLQSLLTKAIILLAIIGIVSGMLSKGYSATMNLVEAATIKFASVEAINLPELDDNILQAIEDRASLAALTNEDINSINNTYATKQLLRKFYSKKALEIANDSNSDYTKELANHYKVSEDIVVNSSKLIASENDKIAKILIPDSGR